jgi:hypothetical protein
MNPLATTSMLIAQPSLGDGHGQAMGEDPLQEWRAVPVDKYAFVAVCTDLRPDTEYEFYVQSCSLTGDGPASSMVTCRTNPTCPAAPPTNLRLVEAQLDEIEVAWDPPAGPTNGEVQGYRLFFDLEGSSEYTEVQLPANGHRYRARFLSKDSVYRFQGTSREGGTLGPPLAGPPIARHACIPALIMA